MEADDDRYDDNEITDEEIERVLRWEENWFRKVTRTKTLGSKVALRFPDRGAPREGD